MDRTAADVCDRWRAATVAVCRSFCVEAALNNHKQMSLSRFKLLVFLLRFVQQSLSAVYCPIKDMNKTSLRWSQKSYFSYFTDVVSNFCIYL